MTLIVHLIIMMIFTLNLNNRLIMDRRIIKDRNVSVDVLRILLALMVVTIHIGAPATGHVLNSISWTPTKLFAYIVHYASIPAVNVYILISGYFSYSQNHDYKRLFKKAVSLFGIIVLFFGRFADNLSNK